MKVLVAGSTGALRRADDDRTRRRGARGARTDRGPPTRRRSSKPLAQSPSMQTSSSPTV